MARRNRRVAGTGILATSTATGKDAQVPPTHVMSNTVQVPRIPPAHMHHQQPWQQPRQQQRPPWQSSSSAPLMRYQQPRPRMARPSYDMQYDENHYPTDPYYSILMYETIM